MAPLWEGLWMYQLSFGEGTPPKTNMEPENEALEEEISILKTTIFTFHARFRGGKGKF